MGGLVVVSCCNSLAKARWRKWGRIKPVYRLARAPLHGSALPYARATAGAEEWGSRGIITASKTTGYNFKILVFSEDGSKTKNPYGKRKTQQKHHAERQRCKDPGETRLFLAG